MKIISVLLLATCTLSLHFTEITPEQAVGGIFASCDDNDNDYLEKGW